MEHHLSSLRSHVDTAHCVRVPIADINMDPAALSRLRHNGIHSSTLTVLTTRLNILPQQQHNRRSVALGSFTRWQHPAVRHGRTLYVSGNSCLVYSFCTCWLHFRQHLGCRIHHVRTDKLH